jgi:hypothetical protein
VFLAFSATLFDKPHAELLWRGCSTTINGVALNNAEGSGEATQQLWESHSTSLPTERVERRSETKTIIPTHNNEELRNYTRRIQRTI